MPSRGVPEGLVFLQHIQASKFGNPRATAETIVDRSKQAWQVCLGLIDGEEKNYGVFDNGELVAHVTLVAPETDAGCQTPFWIIGRIAVATGFQERGIGPALATAACRLHGQPLASDLNQAAGGASMWKRLIVDNPGQIELHDGQGGSQPVQVVGGKPAPDPWAHPDRRLVRRS